MTDIEITPWSSSDSLEEITDLLHRAYAPLAAEGLNFKAADQSLDETASRLSTASMAWIAKRVGTIIGTIAYYSVRRYDTEPEYYKRSDVAHFGQFAVEPNLQNDGIGAALLRTVEEYARGDGKLHLSCDTAEKAARLIDYYQHKGYIKCGQHRWPHAVYPSVVLTKRIC